MNTQAPNRILLAADFLRPLVGDVCRSSTVPHVRWLQALLEWPLSQICALEVGTIAWGDGFDTERFYRTLRRPTSIESWAAVHYSTELPGEAEAMIVEAFEGSLVIGYELPPCVVSALHRNGIAVIDMVVTPLRFLDDILIALRSTVPAVQDRIEKYRFDDSLAHQQAGLLRAKMAWSPFEPIPRDTALIVGQVGADSALIHREKGRLLSFADYVEELFDVAARHESVLYKPHPYEVQYGESASVIARFKSFRRTDANFYQLLSQPGLGAVYAISSGCVSEAPYFGKSGECFYQTLHSLEEHTTQDWGLLALVAVDQNWITPGFWRDVIEPLAEVRAGRWNTLPSRAHRIRRSLNADWGFMPVDDVVASRLRPTLSRGLAR
ncbi:MAG: hypothetical protein KJZ83_16835 [Burkholderiaceae bacterium]|nr:hypothetical protein [Burkholderiaceae bacterium]